MGVLLIESRSSLISFAYKFVAAVGLCDDNDLRWKEAAWACEMLVSLMRVGALGWPMTKLKACAQDDEQQTLIAKPGITDKAVVFIVGRLGSSSSRVSLSSAEYYCWYE